jgi:hypothetical protein
MPLDDVHSSSQRAWPRAVASLLHSPEVALLHAGHQLGPYSPVNGSNCAVSGTACAAMAARPASKRARGVGHGVVRRRSLVQRTEVDAGVVCAGRPNQPGASANQPSALAN